MNILSVCIYRNFISILLVNFTTLSKKRLDLSLRRSTVLEMMKVIDQTPSDDTVTILGFGSLLSEKSARSTFPRLRSFRLGKVLNYRRVFAHPASIFFQREISNMDTLEMSSLSAEYCPGAGTSFICSVFEVDGEFVKETTRGGGDMDSHDTVSVPSMAFLEREEEFDIISVPYQERLEAGIVEDTSTTLNDTLTITTSCMAPSSYLYETAKSNGILCTRSTDEKFISRWGQDRFDENYSKYGISTIWNWDESSGLRPCGPYLRHCVLAAEKLGKECYDSFLDETVLVDRTTTIRTYLEIHPEVMDILPPLELAERYGG